jgi:NAD(P)-dependent dehydrogenase (short-subunit alcohol dehydrogenase family)
MSRKLALVTGGSGGIGASVARLLADDHDLALAYASNQPRAEGVKREIELAAPSAQVRIFGGRLRGYDDAAGLAANVKSEFGRAPDTLVNLTGGTYDKLFLGSDFACHQGLLGEHLIVTMALCHVLLRDMYKAHFGRIVNIGSVSARYSQRGQCSYSAAKAAIEAFSRTLALEVAHRGITVNVVAPGLVRSHLTAPLIANLEETKGDLERRIPVGVVGEPDDVGHLVRFLCSQQASYITGAVYVVDGGRSLGDPSS